MSDSKNDFLNILMKTAANDPDFREKLKKHPKEAIEAKLKFSLPENFEVVVHEDTPVKLNLVLPAQSDELSEAELSAVAGGVCWSDNSDPCPNDNCCPSDIKLKKNIKLIN